MQNKCKKCEHVIKEICGYCRNSDDKGFSSDPKKKHARKRNEINPFILSDLSDEIDSFILGDSDEILITIAMAKAPLSDADKRKLDAYLMKKWSSVLQ